MSNIEQQWQGFVPEFVEGIVYRDHKHLIIRNIANALSALALWASVGFTLIELVQKCQCGLCNPVTISGPMIEAVEAIPQQMSHILTFPRLAGYRSTL